MSTTSKHDYSKDENEEEEEEEKIDEATFRPHLFDMKPTLRPPIEVDDEMKEEEDSFTVGDPPTFPPHRQLIIN